MNKDSLNMQVRKFLKKVGVTSQRTIEEALAQAAADNKLNIGDKVNATMMLTIGEIDVSLTIEDTIIIE